MIKISKYFDLMRLQFPNRHRHYVACPLDKAHKIIDVIEFMVCGDVECYVLPLAYNWKWGTPDFGNIFLHQSKILQIPNKKIKHQYLMFS